MSRPSLKGVLLAGALLALAAPQARAGAVLDRLRQEGVLHCGATIRPGLAFPAADGTWQGLEVELCRAAAVAVLGPGARIAFHGYTDVAASFEPVRQGSDALSFLTASEMLAQGLLPAVLPGPAVFYRAAGVMVMDGSPARNLADLRDQRVCAEPGTGPERSLNAWYAAHAISIAFFPFQEPEEMQDAFYGGRCVAVANDLVSLAALRLQARADAHPARLLPDVLAAVPVFATTPRGDGDWSAVVAWTMQTLLRAQTQGQPGPGGGGDPLPLSGAALGLSPGWQAAVVQAVGSYGAIYDRTLGAGSPLGLPRGLNALWTEGGLMCPPFTE